MWSGYIQNNIWRELKLSVPYFATAARKSFNCKFTAKNNFSDLTFYVTITKTDIQNFLYTSFVKYLDYMLAKHREQNLMERNIPNFKLFGKK